MDNSKAHLDPSKGTVVKELSNIKIDLFLLPANLRDQALTKRLVP